MSIATEPTSNPLRDWVTGTRTPRPGCAVGACENQSGDIPLTAGQLYYFEALNLDINAGSGDNLSFTWQIPGGPVITNGAAPIGAQYLVGLADPVTEAAYLCAAASCPTLHASLAGSTLTLSWTSAPGCKLQVNSTDIGNKTAWSDVANGATSPVNVTVAPGAGKKFYRLKHD